MITFGLATVIAGSVVYAHHRYQLGWPLTIFLVVTLGAMFGAIQGVIRCSIS